MQKGQRPVAEAFAMVLQFGFNMIVPIGIMSLIGWWIGEKTGLSWIMIPFFFVGAIAGGNSIYQMTKKQLKNNKYTYPKAAKGKKTTKAKQAAQDKVL